MKTVLLIEDETNIRAMYSEILKEDGFEVVEASEGEQGISLVENSNWDILLLDIMLPKLDGVELLKKLQINPRFKDKPVLVISNLDDAEVKKMCLDLGVKEFIIKSNAVPRDIVLAVKRYLVEEQEPAA